MENNTELVALCTDKAKQWLSPSFDEGTRKSVQAMLDNSDKTELIECFYKDLEFGTGGLRGIMGAGSNRMNIYTVGMATQGFANYLKKNFAGRSSVSVVVCHDCRNNSRLFAETVADIFSANGILIISGAALSNARASSSSAVSALPSIFSADASCILIYMAHRRFPLFSASSMYSRLQAAASAYFPSARSICCLTVRSIGMHGFITSCSAPSSVIHSSRAPIPSSCPVTDLIHASHISSVFKSIYCFLCFSISLSEAQIASISHFSPLYTARRICSSFASTSILY